VLLYANKLLIILATLDSRAMTLFQEIFVVVYLQWSTCLVSLKTAASPIPNIWRKT